MDSSGPFDYHLTRKLARLCERHGIPCARDVFRYYRSDSASAVEAGNDLRTALACFGVDGTHGWERTHLDGLTALADLLSRYILSGPTFERDAEELSALEGFPHQPTEPAES
jgi:putative aminopeptidase FrvX